MSEVLGKGEGMNFVMGLLFVLLIAGCSESVERIQSEASNKFLERIFEDIEERRIERMLEEINKPFCHYEEMIELKGKTWTYTIKPCWRTVIF